MSEGKVDPYKLALNHPVKLAAVVELIASSTHTVNHRYCQAIGDPSTPWDETPENIKASVRTGVKLQLSDPNITPRQLHEKWLEYKRAEGWKFEPVKNIEAKEHNCFLPYDELPERQRVKDALFKGVVESLRFLLSETAGFDDDDVLQALANAGGQKATRIDSASGTSPTWRLPNGKEVSDEEILTTHSQFDPRNRVAG